MRLNLTLTTALILFGILAYGQCSLLSTTISVDFSADGTCAPVTVNTFEVTYTFNAPQNPADIEIEFRWNDPGNTTETISGAGLTVSNGDRTYQATASPFPYPDTGPECFFEAQAFIIVDGDECESSEQTQIVPSWNVDDQNGGIIAIDPGAYNVCENTAITNVSFTDASTFNCNIADHPDNPNQISRWTQFVYGTDPAPAVGRIRDVTLEDGGTQVLTDGSGNIASPDTRGTAGLMVTAAYFGQVLEVPFPADVPNNISLPISAPANALNTVGSTFEVTLFNWNTCNPYNGDPLNPNYEDAVSEIVQFTIIPPPAPSYQARDGGPGGPVLTEFCIDSDIYFENLTAGGPYDYTWEFYDGPADTDPLLNTSTDVNPTYNFSAGGPKLVRLIATDPNADGVCDVIYDDVISLSPDAIADFDFYDAGFTTTIAPDFCQTGGDTFTVGFRDNTTLVPNTELLYEFYIEGNPPSSGTPDDTQPPGGVYTSSNIPDFTRSYTNEEYVIVRLIARNTSTLCGSVSQDTIFVYGQPVPNFTTNEACEGARTSFTNIADATSLTTQVNNDEVDTWEWDFSYDGSFNIELVRTDNSDFDWYLDGTDIATGVEPATSADGTYTVALRMTTEKGDCSDIITMPVVVHPNPDAQFSHNAGAEVCPGDIVTFNNTSSNVGLTTNYSLEVAHPPSGFASSDPFPLANLDFAFVNPDDTIRTYQTQIRAETTDGCITLSPIQTIEVSPDEEAEFSDPSYDFFATNCSPWNSTMIVDTETASLNADEYTWTLMDQNGVLAGYPVTVPDSDPDFNEFDYQIVNTSNTIMNYQMVLEAEKAGVCISNDTFNVQISPQPDAAFTVSREDECDRVNFTLEATQKGLANYDWSFNPAPDATFGADDEFQVSFNREANSGSDFNATITLVTTNLASCDSDPEIVIETIEKERPAVVADFTIDPTELQLPDNTITITNNSTAGPGITYLWDFGDGTISTDQNPGTHEYNRFGTYQITLEVTDDFCTVETSQSLTVFPTAPVLDFEADVLEGCAPLTVQFTNLSQFAAPGEYLWEFGDGSVSRSDNPTHTFFQDGNFTVRLRGENEVGETSEIEKEQYINVYGRPFADFLVSARVVYIPDQEAVFRNLSENATNFQWDFGDGTTSTEESPSHAYTEEGFYDITLIASNDFGCVDTLFRSAEIEAISGGQVNTPNAFTPSLNGPTGGNVGSNGNDPSRINDVFLPRLEGVERFRMLIYNKWGQLVFESNSQDVGWDGYYRNQLAPSGVYVYKLELRYSDGRDVIKVGDVTLIR
ncbi:PKD domain-containing protein [Ekhidna sp. MALMAid0563]|uniref:PKD domain-containing protein n=1 Tax=Ekhidna sp. MALMAid0563 TaxID=3143937 RepID=UPI0032DFBFD6